MAVKIRLTRVGKKRQPAYRVVVADSRSPRDGRYIEQIGRYDPTVEPSIVVIDNERAQYWLSNGAQPSSQVKKLLEISGTLEARPVKERKVHVVSEAAQVAAAAEPVAEPEPVAEVETAPEPVAEPEPEPVAEAETAPEPVAEAEPVAEVAEEVAAETDDKVLDLAEPEASEDSENTTAAEEEPS